jgi:hypothetical protein
LLRLTAGDQLALYGYMANSGRVLVGDPTSVGAVYMSINRVSA